MCSISKKEDYIQLKKSVFYEIFNAENPIKEYFQANKKLFGEFIQPNPDILTNYQRFFSTFQSRDGFSLNYIKESILINGELIEECSVSTSKSSALNKSSSKLINKILDTEFKILMPRYLIGLPNYRGHCFFVPVFVPLFNNPRFIQALHEGMDIINKFMMENKVPKPEKKSLRAATAEIWEPEKPFLWSRIVKDFYNKYRSASFSGNLECDNHPPGIELAYPELYSDLVSSEKFGKKSDLRLDRTLMKLVLEMRDFVSNDYANPGGYVNKLVIHIIERLSTEYVGVPTHSPFYKVFYSKIQFDYTCIECRKQWTKVFDTPVIRIPEKHKEFLTVQDFFDNYESLIPLQEKTCRQFFLGRHCPGKHYLIKNINLEAQPEILVLEIVKSDEKKLERIEVPQVLKFGEIFYYRFAYSVTYQCWKDENGDLRSIRHIQRQDKDKSAGWHVIVHILTDKGWMEVNNSEVFKPLELYNQTFAGNIVFYAKQEESFFLPKVGNFFEDDYTFVKNVTNNSDSNVEWSD